MKKQVSIVGTARYYDQCVIKVQYTENGKQRIYKYSIAPSFPLEKILRKPVCGFKDLNFIKTNGELIEKIEI